MATYSNAVQFYMMEEGMEEMALRIFEAAEPTYHPLAAKEIEATLREETS